ncbi:MAG: hypothetical protein AAF849_00515 [Bacteroidota bacterium]
MEFKILGLPFKQGEFKICDNYRGICRNEVPESRFQEDSKVDFLNELYVKFISSDIKQMQITELLEISNSFTELSTEPFELIIAKNIKEEISEDISYKSLGYEVIANNEASMVHFWLRKKVKSFESLYETYKRKLNSKYLFSCIEDAEAFTKEIKQYSHVVYSPSSDIDFEIVEIAKVEGDKY